MANTENPRGRQAFRAPRSVGLIAIPLGVFILAGSLLVIFGSEYEHDLRDREDRDFRAGLDAAGSLLSAAINRRQALLTGIVSFLEARAADASTQKDFLLYAAGLRDNDPAIRAIEVFPPQGPEMVYPEAANKAVIGRGLKDLLADDRPEVQADLRRAIQKGGITLSEPYQLRQGGLALVARQAIFREGRLWGMAALILDIEPLLGIAGISPSNPIPGIAIADRAGRLFFGRSPLPSEKPVSSKISLPEGSWTMSASLPPGATSRLRAEMLPFWLSGLFVALMLAAVSQLAARRYIGLKEELSSRSSELGASREFYRSIFDYAAEGIFLFDAGGECVEINRGACELLGLKREDILHRGIGELFLAEEGIDILGRISEAAEGRLPNGLLKIRRDEGLLLDIEFLWHRDAEGRLQGLARDVTERRRAERLARRAEEETRRLLDIAERSRQALLSMAEDQRKAEEEVRRINSSLELRVAERTALLELSNSEMEAFSYSISHDLRAPLRAIDGFSRFLIEDYSDRLDAEGRRLLEVIRSNTQRMSELINALLDLSRITRSELKLARVDMSALAASVCAEAAPPEAGGSFTLEIGALPEVRGDPSLLRQVWYNLVSNAYKYSMKSPTRRIELGSYEDGDQLVFYVRDQGAGFDPEYSSKLFGVFQRLHRSDEFEGNGVGLAIVQRIVARHGGRVWAEGRPNAGATFFFSLPKREG